jgi:hypothetical protein
LEPFSEFFVSTATAGQYLAAGWVLRIRFPISAVSDFGRGCGGRQLKCSGRGAGVARGEKI